MPRAASAAPGSPIAIPESDRTATSTPSAIASSHGSANRLRPPRRFSPISAKSSTKTASMLTFATGTGLGAPVGRAPTISGRWREAARATARPFASLRIFSGCARDTTGMRKATRPSGKAWRLSQAGSFTRSRGQKIWIAQVRRSLSWLRRDRGDSHSGDRQALQPRHHAAALADLLHYRAQRQRAR